MARQLTVAILPGGILGQGVWQGKYSPGSTGQTRRDKSDVQVSPRTQAIVDTVAAVASEAGMTKTQVCVNWIRQQTRAEFIPILGARNVAQLQDNLDSVKCTLDEEHIKRLDDVSRIEYGFPRDFVEVGGRQYAFGKTFELTDNHRGNPVW